MANREEQVPTTLGLLLATLREQKGWTLREVEEATGKEVSNAYLSQLENGRIAKPSPHILHSLAEAYEVPYDMLMEKAGYLVRSKAEGQRHGRLPTNAIENLTEDEERALLTYLKIYRAQKKK